MIGCYKNIRMNSDNNLTHSKDISFNDYYNNKLKGICLSFTTVGFVSSTSLCYFKCRLLLYLVYAAEGLMTIVICVCQFL